MEKAFCPVQAIKFIKTIVKNGNTRQYMRITTTGLTLNIDGKGFIVLFDDGTRIEKDAKVDYKNESGTAAWRYSVFESISMRT